MKGIQKLFATLLDLTALELLGVYVRTHVITV